MLQRTNEIEKRSEPFVVTIRITDAFYRLIRRAVFVASM